MHRLKEIYLLQFLLLLLSIIFPKSISQETTVRYGNSIRNLLTPCSVLNSTTCFDNIPDHVPNPCDECKKPDGHCGAELRCICHPKECSEFFQYLASYILFPTLLFFWHCQFKPFHMMHFSEDRVISVGAVLKPFRNIVFFLLFFLILKDYFQAF